jgi:Fe-S cluster biogenesis protein NfuA
MTTDQQIKIRGELMPDPMACTFHVDQPILEEGWSVAFERGGETHGSALPDALFAVEGISAVRITGSSIVLTRDVEQPWQELAAHAVPAIRDAYSAEAPLVAEEALAEIKDAPLDEIGPMIQRLLDQHINPSLASHGGFARLVKVEDRDVYLEMGGGCQGCAASRLTLRNGIETAIRRVVPQVREVIDVTDHEAGANPYYAE